VILIGTEATEADSVANDYRQIANELLEHAPTAI
jgi:hypothetical protein